MTSQLTTPRGQSFNQAVVIVPNGVFANTGVWASDPWYHWAAGSVRNLNVLNHNPAGPRPLPFDVGSNSFTIGQARFLGMINIPLNFQVEFSIFPAPDMPTLAWRNVMHMTVSGDWGNAQRIPSVWFCHGHAGCPGGPMALHICYYAINGQQVRKGAELSNEHKKFLTLTPPPPRSLLP